MKDTIKYERLENGLLYHDTYGIVKEIIHNLKIDKILIRLNIDGAWSNELLWVSSKNVIVFLPII